MDLVLLWLLVFGMRMISPCGLFLVRFVVVDLIWSALMETTLNKISILIEFYYKIGLLKFPFRKIFNHLNSFNKIQSD